MVDDPNRPEDDNSFDNFPEDNFPGNDFPADDFGGENNSFNDPSFMEEDDFLAADRGIPDDLDTAPPKPNLKEIWDQNPSVKIFAAIAFVAVFLIAYMVFGSSSDESDPKNTSMVSQAGEVSQPPGTQELPPAYEEAVRQASEQRAETAANSGGSAIPTPIARPSERIEAPVQVEETDPLSEWRREAEERRNEREQGETPAAESVPLLPENAPPANNLGGGVAQQPQNPPLPTGPTPEMVQGISQQLQQQMQTIMETQIPKESIVVSMNIQPGYDMKKYFPEPTTEAAAAAAGTNAAAAAAANQPPPVPIVSAGTIAYGQILTEANSDVPGPILAEIASGPLLGGRAIGQFSVAQRHLVLQFNRVVKDGVEYPVQVYALDPATTLPGVATDIDRHYFSRVFLPAAARFIEGFASAATQTDNSVVVVDGSVVSNTSDLNTRQELLNGADEAAQQLSSVLEQDFGDRPVTIKVAAGTRVGLLFLSSVFDPKAQQQQQYGQQPGSQYQNAANGYVGQAYNAYNAYNNYANGNNNGYANNNGYNNQQYSNGQQQQYYNNTQQNRQQPVSQQQLFSTLRNNR